MRFSPPCCPNRDCRAHPHATFRFRRNGFFRRQCDGRLVQRFICVECRRRFSSQTFRLDYRLKKPRLHLALFPHFVSKVTHRQSARLLRCTRRTVARRLLLLAEHCRGVHQRELDRQQRRGGLRGSFQLDELETFERSRKLGPVTVPVLVEQSSWFVVHATAAPLPCRGRLSPADRRRRVRWELEHGKRRSGSTVAVRSCFEQLRSVCAVGPVIIRTDRKVSYGATLRTVFGDRVMHERHSSRGRRDRTCALFAINHTFAQLRDSLSRLVRRNWANSKRRGWLERHLWLWIAWRNYVRPMTNRSPAITSAMAVGVCMRKWSLSDLLTWRVDDASRSG